MKANLMKPSMTLSKMKLTHPNLKLPKLIHQLKLRRKKKHEQKARETNAE
jgi:hypothetical protein